MFIEPLVAVDLANHWRELQIEEQREIERIFRRLSGLVGEAASALTNNVDLLATLDLILRRRAWAKSYRPAARPCCRRRPRPRPDGVAGEGRPSASSWSRRATAC